MCFLASTYGRNKKIDNGTQPPRPKQTYTLRLTRELRRELKEPLGTLIRGTPEQTMKQLKKLIKKGKPVKTIAVGDVVTENMVKNSIPISVMIVDNRVLRRSISPTKAETHTILNVSNPSGMLTPETWTTVHEALEQDKTTRVLVEGEEDLFTLVAVSQAPENSLVVYGQPHEGVVAVRVTPQTRRKVQTVIDSMQPIDEKPK